MMPLHPLKGESGVMHFVASRGRSFATLVNFIIEQMRKNDPRDSNQGVGFFRDACDELQRVGGSVLENN